MTKNPFINAFSASAYIALVVSVMNVVTRTQGSKPDSTFAPIMFISLLTLSVAVMAYLFFYQPLQFLIDGKRKEALNLFVKTIGVFGAITVVVSILVLSGLI